MDSADLNDNESNLAEIGADVDGEDEDFFAQSEVEGEDDELMFNEVAEFLAQISEEDKSTLYTLVNQVLAEQYSEDGNILLA